MKILDIFRINIKKLKNKFSKALFLIIPVTVLMALSVIVGSQVINIQKAVEGTVFKTISNQYRLIQVAIQTKQFDPSQVLKESTDTQTVTKYSNSDVTTVKSIEGVQSASLLSAIPITNIKTGDLVKDKSIAFSQLYSLDSDSSSLYTSDSFNYVEGEPIPIIINTSTLVNRYEDWSSGNTITYDMSKPATTGSTTSTTPQRLSIIKEEAITISKEELVGKTFTLNFGGLDTIADYTMTRDGTKVTFKKLSTTEYNTKVADRKTTIAKYWNYSKISKPITYTFKIVGVIEDSSAQINYVPTSFSDVLMKSYISNEIAARTKTIDTTLLNTDYMGLTYNGDELSNGSSSIFGQIGRRFEGAVRGSMGGVGRPPEFHSESVSFTAVNIPGLVIKTDSTSTVTGVNTDTNIFSKANKYGDKINIVLTDSSLRESVISKLNKSGYSFQDNNQIEVLSKLQSNLSNISKWFMVVFILLIASIIVLTMSKFISESIREIGIFRALGMTKSNILVMFISQTLMYVSVGYIFGISIGYILNQVSGTIVSSWFSQFINDTVSQSYSVTSTVESSIFMNTSWLNIGIYSAILLAISLIISIIPSMSAAKVSPVQAIKSE